MVFYHGFYLFGQYGGYAIGNTLYGFFRPVQLLFASVFILISGFCTQLSRNVAKRGILLLCIALSLSAITILALPKIGWDGFQDRFGILHLLSCCMLLYALLRKAIDRVPLKIGLPVCIVLYASTCMLQSSRIGFPFASAALPVALTQLRFLFPFGIHDAQFYSADYFPLLPHAFVFFAGCMIGRVVCSGTIPESAYRIHSRFFAFFGRHSLLVYLLHIPALAAVLFIIQLLRR